MRIEELIADEREYFSPILTRQAATTEEMKQLWRRETVTERRLRLASEIHERFGGVIHYGPFAGLHLVDNSSWNNADFPSMLLGLYEAEVLQTLVAPEMAHLDTFISLGAADGYYPLGMCLCGRAKIACAFELTEAGRQSILINARRNGLEDRITIFGKATNDFPTQLTGIDPATMLVLVDIEGAEFSVLDEQCLASLSHATIVVEIHNWVDKFWEQYKAFLERAARNFEITIIPPEERKLVERAELRDMPDENRALIRAEGRPNQMRFLKLCPLRREE